MKHVFISYKHTDDLDFAENVCSRLERAGFPFWIDDHHIHAGEEWRNQIDQAIKDALAVIAIMTPEAKASEYVTYEWAYAAGAGLRVIPLMLKKTKLHPRLSAFQYLDFTNNVRPWEKLIAEVKAAAQAAIEATTESKAPSFIEQARAALNSTQADMRENAIHTLAQANGPAAQEMLLEALAHPIADVRMHAAKAVGKLKIRAAVPTLIKLFHDPDISVQEATVTALCMIGDSSAIAPLLETLEQASPYEKFHIVEILRWLGDASMVPVLLDIYEKETAAELREKVIGLLYECYFLGHLEEFIFIPMLKDALSTPAATSAARMLVTIDSDETIRILMEALLSLPELQSKALIQAIKQCNVKRLIARLGDVYQAHLQTYVSSRRAEVGRGPVAHGPRSTDPKHRRKIIWLLDCLENSDAMPTLIQAIDDPNKTVVYEAVRAMKRLGSERSCPALETILKRHAEGFDDPTLMLTVQALAQVGNMHTVLELQSFLLAMLNKHNIELSVQAIEALGKLGDYDTIGYLRSMDLKFEVHELRSKTEYLEIRDAIDQAIKEIRSRLSA